NGQRGSTRRRCDTKPASSQSGAIGGNSTQAGLGRTAPAGAARAGPRMDRHRRRGRRHPRGPAQETRPRRGTGGRRAGAGRLASRSNRIYFAFAFEAGYHIEGSPSSRTSPGTPMRRYLLLTGSVAVMLLVAALGWQRNEPVNPHTWASKATPERPTVAVLLEF